MNAEMKPNPNWFKRILSKYDNFIKTYGLNKAGCCCVPKIEEDENGNLKKTEFFLKKENSTGKVR